MNGQFHVDPENLSPKVKWGQIVIWRKNNPNHDSNQHQNEMWKRWISPKSSQNYLTWTVIIRDYPNIILG